MRLRSQKLGFRSLYFSSSVFSTNPNIQLFSRSLFKLHESSIFSTMQLRGGGIKGDEHLPFATEKLSLDDVRQLIVSRRNVLLVSVPPLPNPLRFIQSLFRNIGRHFCSRGARVNIPVYLFYSDESIGPSSLWIFLKSSFFLDITEAIIRCKIKATIEHNVILSTSISLRIYRILSYNDII